MTSLNLEDVSENGEGGTADAFEDIIAYIIDISGNEEDGENFTEDQENFCILPLSKNNMRRYLLRLNFKTQ